jgi:hypothetical protein
VGYKFLLVKRKLERDGLLAFLTALGRVLIGKFSIFQFRADFRRRILGNYLYKEFGGMVKYGAFSGLKIPSRLVWAKNDLGSILVGFYELQVVEWIFSRNQRFHRLVDIGSADGIYLAGILQANLAETAIGFESSQKGRYSSHQILRLNNLEERAEVLGTADSTTLISMLSNPASRKDDWSLMICDIEGGEAELFDASVVSLLEKYFIVIELHEWTYGPNTVAEMCGMFSRTHKVQLLESSARNPNGIAELRELADDLRWNICSEGRRQSMRWLVATPVKYNSA